MADSNAEGTAARERLQAIWRAIARLPASDEIDGGAVERVSEEHTVRQILDDPEAGAPVEGLCMEQVHMTVWSTDGRRHTAGCVAAVIATLTEIPLPTLRPMTTEMRRRRVAKLGKVVLIAGVRTRTGPRPSGGWWDSTPRAPRTCSTAGTRRRDCWRSRRKKSPRRSAGCSTARRQRGYGGAPEGGQREQAKGKGRPLPPPRAGGGRNSTRAGRGESARGRPRSRGYAASLHSLASAAWSRRLCSPPPRRISVRFLSIRPAFTLPPTGGRRCFGTPERLNTYSRFEGRAGRGCADERVAQDRARGEDMVGEATCRRLLFRSSFISSPLRMQVASWTVAGMVCVANGEKRSEMYEYAFPPRAPVDFASGLFGGGHGTRGIVGGRLPLTGMMSGRRRQEFQWRGPCR